MIKINLKLNNLELTRNYKIIWNTSGLQHFNQEDFHTGQNYDENLSNIFFNDLSLRRPDYYLCI